MRRELCEALVQFASSPDMVFMTGDLGFMALEPLREAMGNRFINAGVAEQNMISVAAAMAKDHWRPWCYSIAPFCFARPFEQIRNDVCLHDLPVKLLGNGGGYGYGVMGPTHHAVEDYGVLLALPSMQVFVPCFNEDVVSVVSLAWACRHPCYVRLGRGELPTGLTAPPYAAWRQVLSGGGPVVIAVGPIAGLAWETLRALPKDQCPNLWIIAEMPLRVETMPAPLLARLSSTGSVLVIEEHIAQGGVGAQLAHLSLTCGLGISRMRHLSAAGLDLGVYGSQAYLRSASRLDGAAISAAVAALED